VHRYCLRDGGNRLDRLMRSSESTIFRQDDERFDDAPPEVVAPEAVAPAFWTVAIYMTDRAYGGPEEGGWYYTKGERVDLPMDSIAATDLLSVFSNGNAEEEACAHCRVLNDRLNATANVGRREIGSVLSRGRYAAGVFPGHPPQHFPERRPHYE
jgi:hypothetical protein